MQPDKKTVPEDKAPCPNHGEPENEPVPEDKVQDQNHKEPVEESDKKEQVPSVPAPPEPCAIEDTTCDKKVPGSKDTADGASNELHVRRFSRRRRVLLRYR